METNIEKMRADIKKSNRTFLLQAISAAIVLLAVGAVLGHYFIK